MLDLNLEDFYYDGSFIKKSLENINLESFSAGKHLRHLLLERTGTFLNIDHKTLMALGRIGELVHNATLTHDDVIDHSHTRRGHPSIPALLNNKKSVLLGDYILAKSLSELTVFENSKLINCLAITLRDLVEGEWIQMEQTNPYKVDAQTYETLAVKKTGSLLRWSFIAPSTYKLLTDDQIAVFASFGEQLGVLYQITDDIIDFNDSSKKTNALDIKNNNVNYVLHLAGQTSPELCLNMFELKDFEKFNDSQKELIYKSIELAKNHVNDKLKICKSLLNDILQMQDANSDISAIEELDQLLELVANRVF